MMRRTKASVSRTDSDFLTTRAGHFDLLAARGQAEQGTGMAHFDPALLQQLLDLVGQFHEAQQIADRGARAAHRLGRGLMRQTEFLDQSAASARASSRGFEIFALNVFDERHGDRGFIRHVANNRGNLRKPAICAARQRRSPAMIS